MSKNAVRDAHYYMNRALRSAHKAYKNDEVPVGAVVVSPEGYIVGQGYNLVETRGQQQAHAEMIAIARACKKIGDWRLDGYSLYVTLQPCVMCMGLIQLSRISRLVYGAHSKLFGYQLDNEGHVQVYNKDIEIMPSVLADESAHLLQRFFKEKRADRDRAS